jgi:hypothetical protein
MLRCWIPRFRAADARVYGDPARAVGARRRADGQSGAALFAVILLTALILSLGIFGSRTSQIELAIAGNDLQAKRALEIAEAGVSHAFSVIAQEGMSGLNEAADGFDDELSNGGTAGALAGIGSAATVNGDTYRFQHFGGPSGTDGYYVHAIDNEDETNGLNDSSADVDGRIHLISRGHAGRAERVIEAIIEREPSFTCVLCGARDFPLLPIDITLAGSALTDSFNSNVGPYNVGTAGTSGHIQSNGGVSMAGLSLLPFNVRGNVTASDAVVQLFTNVTGTVTQFAQPVAYPAVPPCGPPYPANTGMSGGLYTRSLGTLVSIGNNVIDLAPGDYCFSSITMAGLSSLRVTGATRIFLTQPSTLLGITNTTNVASNLRIYSSVTSPIPPLPIVPALTINGGAQAAMAVYAPDAVVEFAGLTDFYGSVVGAIIPTIGISNMHYDQALQSPPIKLVGWRELRNYVPD